MIFDKIIDGEITAGDISKSHFYSDIEQRIKDFSLFEIILDSNELVFKYSKNRSSFSNINAEYLLKTLYDERTNYIFINSSNERESKLCVSFFFNDSNNYTENQVTMTMLYKEKIHIDSGLSDIQFNKLK